MFLSKRLSPAEENYPTHEREMLAIVTAMRKWRVYLDTNIPFTVYTDHNPLKYVQTQKEMSKRMHRWMETLQSFNFTPVYKPGKLMQVPDALSRLMCGATAEDTAEVGDFDLNLTEHDYLHDPKFAEIYTRLPNESEWKLPETTGEGSHYRLYAHVRALHI